MQEEEKNNGMEGMSVEEMFLGVEKTVKVTPKKRRKMTPKS